MLTLLEEQFGKHLHDLEVDWKSCVLAKKKKEETRCSW